MTETSPATASPAPDTSAAPVPTSAPSAAPMTGAPISVRFFAAAAEAAGVEELRLPVPAEGVAVVDLLTELPRLVREQLSTTAGGDDPAGDHDRNTNDGAAVPGLERVCARSSFLVNGVRARSETARLHPGDQLDVLPPFAGG
ncbi:MULTISPECIES: MoaD/ThiS family protein [unclassified Nesterenkonia]|uniref:MoaD/ThiS family protein n=1 Tax=unclassified Nesterenkonia TaxID=2629769 RepID=UPI002107F983|nr:MULTISPECIES: MoaD/ThiS family protein [unclassified Nesterenkonia]